MSDHIRRYAEHITQRAAKSIDVAVRPSTVADVLKMHEGPGPTFEDGYSQESHGSYTWDPNEMFILLAKVRELERQITELKLCASQGSPSQPSSVESSERG